MGSISKLLSLVVLAVGAASASSPPVVPSNAPTTGDQPAFSCTGKPLDLSKDQLQTLALSEYEKRGGTLHRGAFEIKLRRSGCDWWVGVIFLPPAPGAHFGVLIDGVSGQVKQYLPGA
jgi:hypothetical protein